MKWEDGFLWVIQAPINTLYTDLSAPAAPIAACCESINIRKTNEVCSCYLAATFACAGAAPSGESLPCALCAEIILPRHLSSTRKCDTGVVYGGLPKVAWVLLEDGVRRVIIYMTTHHSWRWMLFGTSTNSIAGLSGLEIPMAFGANESIEKNSV